MATRGRIFRAGRVRAAGLLLGLCLAVSGVATAHAAAPAWLAPVGLSAPGKDAIDPRVAMGSGGETVAIWEREGKTPFENAIQASTRSPGAGFSGAVGLSVPAYDPDVAITPGGEAIAVWWRSAGANYALQASTRPPGGSFSAPVTVAFAPTGASPPSTRVAVNADGDTAIAWGTRGTPEQTEEEEKEEEEKEVPVQPGPVSIVEASVRQAGGAFSEPEVVSPQPLEKDRSAISPGVAIDGAGNAIVTWAYNVEPPDEPKEGEDLERRVEYAYRSAAGPEFGGPEPVSAAGISAGTPEVAMDAAGTAVAVWARSDEGDSLIESAARPPGPGGEFSAAQELSTAASVSVTPRLAMTPGGSATVVWVQLTEAARFLQARTRAPGGAWSSTQNLTPGGESSESVSPVLAVSPGGGGIVAWSGRSEGGQTVVKASLRPAGGSFSAPAAISAAGGGFFHPDAAIDGEGNATVVWNRTIGADEIVEAVGYDALPAVLRGVSIPASATVRRPVRFSVSPYDVWPVASTSFDFGDGATASGRQVSHSFSRPGRYRVSVAVVDASGGRATASGEIAVAPAYEFSIVGRKRNRKRGIVLLTLRLGEAGRASVFGKQVRRRVRRRAGAGTVVLPVVAKGRTLKRLRRRGKARVRIALGFHPDGGDRTARRRVRVVLRKRARKKHRGTARHGKRGHRAARSTNR